MIPYSPSLGTHYQYAIHYFISAINEPYPPQRQWLECVMYNALFESMIGDESHES